MHSGASSSVYECLFFVITVVRMWSRLNFLLVSIVGANPIIAVGLIMEPTVVVELILCFLPNFPTFCDKSEPHFL